MIKLYSIIVYKYHNQTGLTIIIYNCNQKKKKESFSIYGNIFLWFLVYNY